jgi:hypothetical protein
VSLKHANWSADWRAWKELQKAGEESRASMAMGLGTRIGINLRRNVRLWDNPLPEARNPG